MYDDIPCNSTTMLDFFQYLHKSGGDSELNSYKTLFGGFQSKYITFLIKFDILPHYILK